MSSLYEYQTLINNLFDLIGKIKNKRKIITDIFKTNKQKTYLPIIYIFLDINHDSEISWNEFLAFQGQAKTSLKAKWPFDVTQIRNEFSNMDMDGSGAISRDEFIQVMINSFDRK